MVFRRQWRHPQNRRRYVSSGVDVVTINPPAGVGLGSSTAVTTSNIVNVAQLASVAVAAGPVPTVDPTSPVFIGSAYDSDVTVSIEMAFGDDPFETSPTWTHITDVCRGFSITRGRSRLLDEVQAGVATLRLSNDTGDFSPWNTAGQYSPNVKVLTPVRIRANHASTTYHLFRGFVLSWPNMWTEAGHDAVVEVQAVDGFHLLAMVEDELTESQEAAGTRAGNLLDVAGWPGAWRNIDTGTHNVAALSGDFNTVLDEIQRARLVEDGLFHIDGEGNAVFRDGVTRIEDNTIQATFSDDGAGVDYRNIQVDYDTTQLWNDATVTRTGGTAQNSSDATSISEHGPRDLHLSQTVHVADGEAKAFADWMIAEFKDVRARIPAVMVTPDADPATIWPQALGLDLWDKVNVEVTSVAGDDFDENVYIEGVTHNVTMVGGRVWETVFQLSPDLPFDDFWVLGTSELGTDTRLGY